MATTVFPESGDQITEAAWTSANATLSVADAYRVSGYALSAGTGLNVDISAGTCFINGYQIVSDATQSESVTASQTNYVYLNEDGTITVNTTGTQPADSLFLGTATTDGSGVTAVSHVRDIESGLWVFKKKPSDESVASSTTLQLDDDLVWTSGNGDIWDVTFGLLITVGGGQFKWDLSGFASERYTYFRSNEIYNAVVGTPENINSQYLMIRGVFVSNTSGSVGLEWAQNTSNASAAEVQTGSWVIAKKVLG